MTKVKYDLGWIRWLHTLNTNHTKVEPVKVLYFYWINKPTTHTLHTSNPYSKYNQFLVPFQKGLSYLLPRKHWFPVIKGLLVVGCSVMSWQPPRGCCKEWVCVCRNVQGWGAEAGCSGSQEGTGWGRGGERPKWKRAPQSLWHTQPNAKCLPVTTKEVITLFPQEKQMIKYVYLF